MENCVSIMKIYFKNIFLLIFLFIISSCANNSVSYRHPTATSQQANNIADKCWAAANRQSPVYLCRNVLGCAPDEFGIVISSVAARDNAYGYCLLSNGFVRDR